MLKTCNEVIRSDLQEKKVNRDLAKDKDFKVVRKQLKHANMENMMKSNSDICHLVFSSMEKLTFCVAKDVSKSSKYKKH